MSLQHGTRAMAEKPIHETSEAAFARAIDEKTAGDPLGEAAGRCLQAILPQLNRWMDAEAARGTDESIVMAVLPALVASLTFTAVLNKFPDLESVATMSDAVKSGIDMQWKDARAQALAVAGPKP